MSAPQPYRVIHSAEHYTNPEPVLSPAWREWHATQGDMALARAVMLAEQGSPQGEAWSRIANAHAALANVRARRSDAQ